MYVGSVATDSILRNETSRKVFLFFFCFFILDSRRRALHLQETIGERRGTDDLWKSYEALNKREVVAVVKNESYKLCMYIVRV